MDILLRVTWLTTNKKHTVGLGDPSYLWIQISILPGNYRDATKQKQSIGKAHWWIIPSLADAISMWGRVRLWTAHFKSGWHVILGSLLPAGSRPIEHGTSEEEIPPPGSHHFLSFHLQFQSKGNCTAYTNQTTQFLLKRNSRGWCMWVPLILFLTKVGYVSWRVIKRGKLTAWLVQ